MLPQDFTKTSKLGFARVLETHMRSGLGREGRRETFKQKSKAWFATDWYSSSSRELFLRMSCRLGLEGESSTKDVR